MRGETEGDVGSEGPEVEGVEFCDLDPVPEFFCVWWLKFWSRVIGVSCGGFGG